jgi:hypothetical protein
MTDLRGAGVDILTLGQYLRPTANHLRVERYVRPEEFDALRSARAGQGFLECVAGPLVRLELSRGTGAGTQQRGPRRRRPRAAWLTSGHLLGERAPDRMEICRRNADASHRRDGGAAVARQGRLRADLARHAGTHGPRHGRTPDELWFLEHPPSSRWA